MRGLTSALRLSEKYILPYSLGILREFLESTSIEPVLITCAKKHLDVAEKAMSFGMPTENYWRSYLTSTRRRQRLPMLKQRRHCNPPNFPSDLPDLSNQRE